MTPPENLDLWNRLGKTDPAHTKGFKRAGGFSGTAIRPIYQIQRMTEVFGPCGEGWMIEPPTFWTTATDEGIAVFCSTAIRTRQDTNGEWSGAIPGVGGDIILKKFRSGSSLLDDEAAKKAFTDALTNAMKLLGMSADVHMGLFDDSKYLAERKREEADAKQPANGRAQRQPAGGYQSRFVRDDDPPPDNRPSALPPHDPATGEVTDDGTMTVRLPPDSTIGVATLEEASKELAAAIRQNDVSWFESEQIIGANITLIGRMPEKWQAALKALSDGKREGAKAEGNRLSGGA